MLSGVWEIKFQLLFFTGGAMKNVSVALLVILAVILTLSVSLQADVTKEKDFVITSGTAKVFFVELGRTKLSALTDIYSSPLLADPYYTGAASWVFKWVPESAESSSFLSPVLARCEQSGKNRYVTTCVDQFYLILSGDDQIISDIHFVNPRYKFRVGAANAGIGTDVKVIEKALGRKLTMGNSYDDQKRDCVLIEGLKDCCPPELKNICFCVEGIPMAPGDVVYGWSIGSPPNTYIEARSHGK